MDLLDRLIAHDLWATPQLLALSSGLSDAQLDQEFDIGHRTLRETFHHLIYNVGFWSAMMSGEPAPNGLNDLSSAGLTEAYLEKQQAFSSLARGFRDDERFDEIFVDHYGVKKSMGSTVVAVLLHNEEHRSEALHILKRLGMADELEIDLGLWDYYQQNEDESGQ